MCARCLWEARLCQKCGTTNSRSYFKNLNDFKPIKTPLNIETTLACMAHNFPGLFSTGYTRAHSSPSLTRAGQIPVHNLLIKNCLSLLKTPLKIEFTRHNLPLLFSAGTFNARYFQCAHNSDTAFSKAARLVKFFLSPALLSPIG